MSHRSPQRPSRNSSPHTPPNLSQHPPLPRRSSPTTRTQGVPAEPVNFKESATAHGSPHAAPRWEQRHRAPSQRETMRREHHEPHEMDARHAPRWNGTENEADRLTESLNAPQWSTQELEDLAHETMAHRGRKLSRRRARVLASRARRRHVDARRTEPHPKTKRPPVWRFLRFVAACLAIGFCFEFGAAALTSPRFAVQNITSDAVTVTPEATIEEVKDTLLGQNFFRARLQNGVKKLAALPSVKSVSVVHQLDWPPHLHINIQERQPFARVDNGGEWWVVDDEGMPFRPATPQDDKLYAVSSKSLKPKLGEKFQSENWTPVVEFAQALQEDKKQGHDWALRAIYFDDHGFASLRLAESSTSPDRTLVHLGTGPWDKKLQRTRQALAWLETKGVQAETLNLISAKRPVWTPRRVEPAAEPEKNAKIEKLNSDHPA